MAGPEFLPTSVPQFKPLPPPPFSLHSPAAPWRGSESGSCEGYSGSAEQMQVEEADGLTEKNQKGLMQRMVGRLLVLQE